MYYSGVHFNTTHQRLLEEIERAVTIFGHGLELFVNDALSLNLSLSPTLSCNGSAETRWTKGDVFFKLVLNSNFKFVLLIQFNAIITNNA